MSTDTPGPPPGGHATDLGWSVGVLLRALQGAMTGVLGDMPHGHRGYQILSTVVHGDQPSQLALAAYLGIDRSVMTYLIDDLVGAGLVERQPNPADRRQRKIVATDKGAEVLSELERRVAEAQNAVLAPLDADDRETLCTLVRRVASDDHNSNPHDDPCEVATEVPDHRRRVT